VQKVLDVFDCLWLWHRLSDDERPSHVQGIADLALSSIWAAHVNARPGLVAAAANGDFDAYRALLCISRGVDPDSKPTPYRSIAEESRPPVPRRHNIDVET
jgi:hypothetical protein